MTMSNLLDNRNKLRPDVILNGQNQIARGHGGGPEASKTRTHFSTARNLDMIEKIALELGRAIP